MISIKKVSISELGELVFAPGYAQWEQIPISRHRALSYINNPRCSPSDVVLYLAYLDGKLVGYRTILPDFITRDNESVKVGWLSGNWVDPNLRRQGIATELLQSAMPDWNNRLLFTNYAEESKAVYDKSGSFARAFSLDGYRIYIRPCLAEVLSKKNRLFRALKPLWQFSDAIFKIFNPVPLYLRSIGLGHGIQYEYLKMPDQEVAKLFKEATNVTATQRGKAELRWILSYPWLVSSPAGDRMGQKYFFSSSPKRFESMLVKVFRDNRLVGFFMLNLKHRYITTPYICCMDGEELYLAGAIMHHALKLGACRITTYHHLIGKQLKRLMPFGMLSLKQRRNYFTTNSLIEEFGDAMVFLEGDGDCAFV